MDIIIKLTYVSGFSLLTLNLIEKEEASKMISPGIFTYP